MLDLCICPSTLAKGFDGYSPRAIKQLFDGVKVSPFLVHDILGNPYRPYGVQNASKMSLSGVQEKFPAVASHGLIRIANEGERATHILKPPPRDPFLQLRKEMPANEHLTMQIATQVYGISTAANGVCFDPKGQPMYITRRFDVLPDGTKQIMEDFASVTGRGEGSRGTQFKYEGSYQEIAEKIHERVGPWMLDMERFFELVLFNYIFANGDDHLKNFALILSGGEYRLAPAYDLLNTRLHVVDEDLGLAGGLSPEVGKSDVYERTGHPCRKDFERFGLHVGIVAPRLSRILDKYMMVQPKTNELVEHSFLSAKTKRSYLRIVAERVSRFIRLSR